jgi:hypothetical protein
MYDLVPDAADSVFCLRLIKQLGKIFKLLDQDAGNCVIIQGFADRGEANEVR